MGNSNQAMKESDELFRLIKSMSKEEKRHFKMAMKSVAQQTTYVKLFDLINDADTYDESSIKLKIKAGNFTALKHTLFNTVLENLKSFHSSKSITNQIREDIESIELLTSRNIVDTSKKLIQKNIQKALDYEHYEQFLEIITQDSAYSQITSYKALSLEILDEQEIEIDQVIDSFNH